MRRLLLPSALALSSLLAACAQTVGNERVDWDHGARHARVARDGGAAGGRGRGTRLPGRTAAA